MLQGYLAELKKIKLLSREEEKLLWEKEAAGDETAHQKLISAYQPLVFKIAMGFHMAEEITMELIQEGTVGLLEAAESYDYTKGVAFSLFAMHRIRGSMCDFLAREYAQTAISLDKEAYDGYSYDHGLVAFDSIGVPKIYQFKVTASDGVSSADRFFDEFYC